MKEKQWILDILDSGDSRILYFVSLPEGSWIIPGFLLAVTSITTSISSLLTEILYFDRGQVELDLDESEGYAMILTIAFHWNAQNKGSPFGVSFQIILVLAVAMLLTEGNAGKNQYMSELLVDLLGEARRIPVSSLMRRSSLASRLLHSTK